LLGLFDRCRSYSSPVGWSEVGVARGFLGPCQA
jgi:hypothetical protein